ncbi:hypothetical protein [Nocardia sp. BMG51109]|uniref:RskA family anti-sigma factor n=1 Tax=Nocardia sp. BMG51109 TaxID=1056816 RepID=UPI00046398E8|nr:hypothetical protein [Nocardia sp. BMG51109]
MNESQIDLAHAVALGSIGDEDQRAVREILDSGSETLRADFDREVQLTREALTVFASAAEQPPAALRDRLLAAVAHGQAPHDQAPAATATPHKAAHSEGSDSTTPY